MAQSASTADESNLRWHQGLDRYCWVVLAVAALGWLFDTMDQNLFNLVRAPSLSDILHLQTGLTGDLLKDAVKEKSGIVTAVFLIGWSVGGFFFGVVGDRLGRTGTMVATILTYAVFTGLSGAPFVKSWEIYALMRFLTAVGVGGEWAAGASLVAEVFPNRSRAMALGSLQALSAVGNMAAAVITLGLANLEGGLENNWRVAYFVGAAPAILVFWIMRSVKEPEKWHAAKSAGEQLGKMSDLFTNAAIRRNTIAATLMAAAGVGALWGVGFFSTDLVRTELQNAQLDPKVIGLRVSMMFLVQNLGSFFGIYLFAAFSEKVNRRTAFFVWFALAWASIVGFFWAIQGSGADAFVRAMVLSPIMGFCALGPFSGYTVYFPELFPTRLRATGCGFCYNAARILAAGAPFLLGGLAAKYGFAKAATMVTSIYLLGFIGTAMAPETRGKPLPD